MSSSGLPSTPLLLRGAQVREHRVHLQNNGKFALAAHRNSFWIINPAECSGSRSHFLFEHAHWEKAGSRFAHGLSDAGHTMELQKQAYQNSRPWHCVITHISWQRRRFIFGGSFSRVARGLGCRTRLECA